MKKIIYLLLGFCLCNGTITFAALADGPIKMTVKTALWGIGSAALGYGVKEAVNFSKAHYTLGFPSTVIPTKESSLWLVGLGTVGVALTTEKIWYERESPIEQFLPIQNADYKRYVGKIIKYGVATATAYALLIGAAHQTPLEATACVTIGGFLELLR